MGAYYYVVLDLVGMSCHSLFASARLGLSCVEGMSAEDSQLSSSVGSLKATELFKELHS